MIINDNINYQYSKYYHLKIFDDILNTYIFTQITLLIYILIPLLINLLKKIKTKISDLNPTKNLLPGDKILIIASIFFALIMLVVYFDSKEIENHNTLKNDYNSSNDKSDNLTLKELLEQHKIKY